MALCPAGDAGAHVVAPRLLGAVERQILGQQGAGAYEGHVAAQHVPQLGQLVEGGGAHEAPGAGEAVGVGEESAVGVAAVGHGLELVETEQAAAAPGTQLREEGAGTFVGEVEPDGHACKHGAEAHESYCGDGDVDGAFEEAAVQGGIKN